MSPRTEQELDDDSDGYADVRHGISCAREEWDLMEPYMREHYRWLIRSGPRCAAHAHLAPCPTCQSYIAAGL